MFTCSIPNTASAAQISPSDIFQQSLAWTHVNWKCFSHLIRYNTFLRSVTIFLNTPYSLNPSTKGREMNYDLQTIWIKIVVSLIDVNSKTQTHGVSVTPSYPASQVSEGPTPNVHCLVYKKVAFVCPEPLFPQSQTYFMYNRSF